MSSSRDIQVFTEIVDYIVNRCIPRVAKIRSALVDLVLEPSTASLINMLSHLRSAEASHIEELGAKLSSRLSDVVSKIVDVASSPPIDVEEAAKHFEDLVSLGFPPAIATEILFVLEPSTCPLIDGVAIAGAKRLGYEATVPSGRDDYVSIVEKVFNELENYVEPLCRTILAVPVYIALDAALQLAYEDRIDREKLLKLKMLGSKLKLLEAVGLLTYTI